LKLDQKYRTEAKHLRNENTFAGKLNVAWKSPSNIALIKYWGKKANQIPQNPSISFTLLNSFTEMSIKIEPKKEQTKTVDFLFDGARNDGFSNRINSFFSTITSYLPFIDEYDFSISSRNSFPHSSGIASSASSMSALALALVDIEKQLFNLEVSATEFDLKSSFLARLGSGSASRSVLGNYSLWGKTTSIENSSDETAIQLPLEVHENFREMGDAILIVSSDKKAVSSSAGHQSMELHPYATARFDQAEQNIQQLIQTLETGDDESFIRIIEEEALSLHALMMSAQVGYNLLHPNTWEIIRKIRNFRKKEGVFITFTLDAGPNVHMIYRYNDRKRIIQFIKQELEFHCESNYWIDDKIGSGPEKIS